MSRLEAEAEAEAARVHAYRYEDLSREFNESQCIAIRAATTERRSLTLIQGPPGTGKTRTALTILEAWLRGGAFRPGTILAASDSNIAVDNLLEGLARRCIRVVRLGRVDAVREDLRHFMPPRELRGVVLSPEQYNKELKRCLAQAEVVCCTTMSAGSSTMMKGLTFEGVLVDEATQATEASTLVALMRGARQLVLLGDQCQLPPTTLSRAPPGTSLDASLSLFTRLVHDGVPPLMLDTQYRMHPALSQLPSDLFYGGRLRDGTLAHERAALEGFPWPRPDVPAALIPVEGAAAGGGEITRGTSFVNVGEADAVVWAVRHLLGSRTTRPGDIGIISPYAAQVQLLRSRAELRGLEVNSIDGFQGREMELIIVSTVRTRGLGFMADARRANVALTRARRGLIVVGAPSHLARTDSAWAFWVRWARARGVVLGEQPHGEYDAAHAREASETIFAATGGGVADALEVDVDARRLTPPCSLARAGRGPGGDRKTQP
ncbi:tRNA-splicing endonuclease positive effector [Chrysochromulina tobinii]|uniref:tRNA-splicing endonuclease positive effector n=1 Tax=Chrysochromulina tobinii TaxID=1460289 RepID=A0A0M0KB67_9EUKA|nr:tRNA-splicing endonuclease positive effector [Chrysochromulina tobinii]|eukprot:KOO36080.1 tRNA-splicing endonuclease positive effector [Chrysochromulina sp. CCMP291]